MKLKLSSLDKKKMTYTATGVFVIGAILFVLGSILLFTVSRADLEEELVEGYPREGGNDTLFE
ncbi:hypothetical protein [Evansella cellulosilytica]|uniref:Uncharacterized protein n=1 Tax=Evansella cellulosilytica (strain ATCC 21833 / DSM 2522 / FERM P-1141 / JCM 9156 / N-4) TaxID=649639 RepID=E6TYZ5_EVAC2|nr:hypothetical protein [Evansella cellulosilytica]ADU32438.1 hypothetical protein Bcell_4211 [Evansella cellulosilytica DSM 2522]